jgi:phosphatidylserine/phosphatidylglycerophosphate/cardiolipin synthase-like enzyme
VSPDPLEPTEAAKRWAAQLPRDFAHRLAAALRAGPADLRGLSADAVQPASAAAVRQALTLTENGDGPFTAGLLAGRLDALGDQPRITPVWTGPESGTPHGRLTLAVLGDLVEEARDELVLASYATVPSDDVRVALAAAASRGVAITLLLERPEDNAHFAGSSDPFPGLAAERLCWPASQRPQGSSMHAKILVVDRRTALVGSANLTGFALERNLECGLLVRGGPVPEQLAEHLLTARGVGPVTTTASARS